jgi:hypothetical protein
MTGKKESASGGIGFCGLLTILFIALKLTGYIEWSWWAVLAPIWIPLVFVGGCVIIIGVFFVIAKIVLD